MSMNRSLLLATVGRRLVRHKAKSTFMGLGVSIAVLVTILLSTAALRVQEKFLSFIERAYPSDSIVVFAGSGPMGGGSRRSTLEISDVETVANTLGIEDWDPILYAGARDIQRAGQTVKVSLIGYSEKAAAIRRRGVEEGEFLSAAEVRSRTRVALLGRTAAARLFPGESPIGETVFLDNVPFVIKGILESVGVDPHGGDQDLAIHVPYTVLLDKARTKLLSGTTFRLEDRGTIDEVSREITRILRQEHQIGEGQADDFTLFTPRSMRAMFDRSFKTVRIFVPLIEATAFLVSVFVIFGILQVSIKGRVAEIGLRKAVGGRAGDVQVQIVLETLAVALVAALLGALVAPFALAAFKPMLAAKMGVDPGTPSIAVMAIAVGLALLTGLLGAWIPARRAAKLQPVAALRSG